MSRSSSPAMASVTHKIDNVSPSISRSSSHSAGGAHASSNGIHRQAAYDSYDYLCKLLVIGDSGAGKSALLKRFSDDQWNPNYSSTIGVDFEVRSVDVLTARGLTKTVKLQMWDTAGQERFRTITSSYYRGAHAVLIVFDVTNEESFQNVRKWLAELDQVSAHSASHGKSSSSAAAGHDGSNRERMAQVLLVANKSDLVRSRVVESHRIEALAAELDLPFVESSAKMNEGVSEAFQTIAAAFVGQRMRDEAAHGGGHIGGPGGKKVHSNFNGVRMDNGAEDDEGDEPSGWKKCMGACSIM